MKRDGTAKARLCVQGSTLEAGIDYDQVFSAALRYSSARALFAYAARNGCKVRSVDLVAAYLQGHFVEGESVYCHLPVGYPQFDKKGRPLIAKVQKPIYGIQQALVRVNGVLGGTGASGSRVRRAVGQVGGRSGGAWVVPEGRAEGDVGTTSG
jgi:hypothetical protein